MNAGLKDRVAALDALPGLMKRAVSAKTAEAKLAVVQELVALVRTAKPLTKKDFQQLMQHCGADFAEVLAMKHKLDHARFKKMSAVIQSMLKQKAKKQ